MATACNISVAQSGGDYSTLQGIFTAAGTLDLTAAATKVFAITGGITGTMTDNTAVTGVISGATGTCVHASSVNSQILIKSITGTFQNGEIVYETLGVNYVTLGDAGNSAYLNIVISGTWTSPDTTSVDTHSVTSSSVNNILITATGSSRHNGQWASNGYIKEKVSSYASGGMTIGNDYLVVDGLQFFSNNNSAFGNLILTGMVDANYNITVKNCIFKSNQTGAGGSQLVGLSDTYNLTVYNCLFYEIGNASITAYLPKPVDVQKPHLLYNNTIYGFKIGIQSNADGDNMRLYNNICNHNTTDYSLGSGNVNHSNNISQDTTSPDTSYRSLTVSFVNTSVFNFNLSGSDTAATGQGADESGTFTTDITGATRTVPWDIGAFKATGGVTKPMNNLTLLGVG